MSRALANRIQQRLDALALTPAAASMKAGLSVDAIRNISRRAEANPQAGVSSRTINALATVLGVSSDWLLTGEEAVFMPQLASASPRSREGVSLQQTLIDPASLPRRIPVFGTAAGAMTGAVTKESEPVEWFPCPPALLRVRDAYGLFVIGDSMTPRYRHGEPIYVNPNRPVRQGDHVVIQEERDGEIQVSIKRFERWTDDYLVTSQYNPVAEVKFRRTKILYVHKVMDLAELLGV